MFKCYQNGCSSVTRMSVQELPEYANGSQDIRTANIDRIADKGTRFTNGYVTFSVCGPSRAGLLTGRYQGRFGFGRNPVIDPTDTTAGLPLSEKMISELMST
ncbi:sulfatase-like hydrolase/transferase [Endozoicomonas sp. SCSIO W0465]|uniref:sulfatase-like hydrolase/transferase n=1 Tax=Endozoicomonas sp. SCSIO W0465 TaxID=2918516 RepID=UPI0020752670|nr:sulfatase-like hydrolase/transferase [Endozoicomonas sp. SCSIO W0465]USE37656.1 sulfatase-like hydrolase/transferase [Endozoicomonas sp. SCSIO W0465]